MSVFFLPCFALQPAGFRPGRASHFHLLAQMKVTKAKGPTRSVRLVCNEGSVGHDHGPAQAGSSKQMNRPDAVRALFLGDFFLGQQKEVTRMPGGTGALPRKAPTRRQGENTGSAT